MNPDRPYKAATPRRGTQDQASYCLGRSDPQTKAPHLTNDLISMGLIRAAADRACHTSSAGNHPTRVTHAHYCMVERAYARAQARTRASARVCACVGAHVSVCVLCAWTCNTWPCVGVRPHSECCTLDKHPRACICRIRQPYPRSRAFPARSAHRPACIKTADLADRWARGRVDTTDENRALRAISTHKPPATSKPAQTASFLSRGGAPEAKVGTRRRPFRLRWPAPGTSETLDGQFSASGER